MVKITLDQIFTVSKRKELTLEKYHYILDISILYKDFWFGGYFGVGGGVGHCIFSF